MYVNSIAFPLNIPLYELFNTYPAVPDKSTLFEFLSMNYRVAIEEVPHSFLSVLMMSLPRDPESGHMLLVNTFEFPVRKEDSLWATMPTIRKIKNSTFESQLKPALKETFQCQ